jgi:hypothetical protein
MTYLGKHNKYLTKSISRKVRKAILRKVRKGLASAAFFYPPTYHKGARKGAKAI